MIKIALTSHYSRMYGSEYAKPGSMNYMITEEILRNDIDTFYVKLLSKRQLTSLTFTISVKKEFVVSTETSNSTVVLGVSHPGLSTNMCGYA